MDMVSKMLHTFVTAGIAVDRGSFAQIVFAEELATPLVTRPIAVESRVEFARKYGLLFKSMEK